MADQSSKNIPGNHSTISLPQFSDPSEWEPLSFETLCTLDVLGVIQDESGNALGLLCEDPEGKQYPVSMESVREFEKTLHVVEGFRQELG